MFQVNGAAAEAAARLRLMERRTQEGGWARYEDDKPLVGIASPQVCRPIQSSPFQQGAWGQELHFFCRQPETEDVSLASWYMLAIECCPVSSNFIKLLQHSCFGWIEIGSQWHLHTCNKCRHDNKHLDGLVVVSCEAPCLQVAEVRTVLNTLTSEYSMRLRTFVALLPIQTPVDLNFLLFRLEAGEKTV